MTRILPRVTQILDAVGLGPDLSGVPDGHLVVARRRGIAVHAAIEADGYGFLDEMTMLDSTTAGYFSGYRKFMVEAQHEPERSEFVVVHQAWRYCGHPDRLGWLPSHRGRKRCLLDWKCVAQPDLDAAARQLAGYVLAWESEHPDEPIDITAVVQLRPDGTYRYYGLDARAKIDVFLGAVIVYHERQRNQPRVA